MGNTSKDLLHLEHKNPSASSLESALLVCKNDSQRKKETKPHEKPITAPIPQSQVLGKVKDFLGVISEANKSLELDAKVNAENYDIEALTGDESQVIEMDLMLGIADLHTPEAVAAAESAISGYQPAIPLADSSSESESDSDPESDSNLDTDSESEDSSDKGETINGDDNDEDSENQNCKKLSSMKPKTSKSDKGNSSGEVTKNRKSSKRPKIVEL
ncbi:hypothetical protein L484_003729 [Morus notabilis]|uniref:Uncharacterized protein n=1 Tax=Morus notabilis TaxID=981085 RepID=W9QZQ7_9ROSA|nr:uncharacterized protein LOC21387253 [Morus notabilis]EXB61535.1 hypothetical protein L484_003729 [Morus notabilis]